MVISQEEFSKLLEESVDGRKVNCIFGSNVLLALEPSNAWAFQRVKELRGESTEESTGEDK